MSADQHLSDRMPPVAAGRAGWSAADEAHLARCEDCRLEWALVRQADGLGREVERGLDLNAIEAGVLAGLRAPAARRSLRPVAWLIPLATAAAVIVIVLLSSRAPDSPAGTVATLLPELETLSSSELESMLTLLPAAAARAPDGFEDLTESELSSVIQDLEG